MSFCPKCDRAMVRATATGAVQWHCTACGEVVDGTLWDARVGGSVAGAGETLDVYQRLIRAAPFDRVNMLVKRDCPDCGRDYMTQLRLGEDEVIIFACKCGHTAKGDAEKRAPGGSSDVSQSPTSAPGKRDARAPASDRTTGGGERPATTAQSTLAALIDAMVAGTSAPRAPSASEKTATAI